MYWVLNTCPILSSKDWWREARALDLSGIDRDTNFNFSPYHRPAPPPERNRIGVYRTTITKVTHEYHHNANRGVSEKVREEQLKLVRYVRGRVCLSWFFWRDRFPRGLKRTRVWGVCRGVYHLRRSCSGKLLSNQHFSCEGGRRTNLHTTLII